MKRHRHFLILVISLCLSKSTLQQDCVNTWDVDSIPFDVEPCPVATENGEICNFPFSYNGNQFRTCIINSPSNVDKIPQCKTTSGVWANCVVPTNAVITKVTTRKAGDAWVNGVSLNGGTLIWITGRRFAPNTFSFSPTETTSNEVFLANGISSYSCEIHPDKVTTTQVTCYAPEMPAGTYLVRVKVNGNFIPLYQYENTANADIVVADANTPKLNTITPMSGVPGTIITITGDFKTSCYTRDDSIDGCADDSGARISRIYFGGQICNLIDPLTADFYQPLTQYALKCKLQGSEINVFNGSILVSEQYGRSLTSKNAYLVSPDEKFYNFRTYPEITSIYPQNGSVIGGTHLTIIGSYFYHEESLPAVIEIGGTPCEVLSYEPKNKYDSKLVCKTSAKPTLSTDNLGGRGITLITQNVLTSSSALTSANPSSSATITILDKASYAYSVSSDVTLWLKGYFVPAKSSDYRFEITANSYGIFYISNDETSSAKQALLSFTTSGNKIVNKYLEGGKRYYIELVSSKQGGSLTVAINARMLDTYLTDSISNVVNNEIQEIEINSTLTLEAFTISFDNSPISNGTSEIQQILINSSFSVPFSLSFDGAKTIWLDFQSTQTEIENALNDLPTLGANFVTVTEISSQDPSVRLFNVTFLSTLGDVPLIQNESEDGSIEIIESQKGSANGKNIQLLIENTPSPLFNLYDTQANLKKVFQESFGIRCPSSLIKPSASQIHSIFDFENCVDSDLPLNETAFCGSCSAKTNIIVQNINSSLTFNYLCFAYKTENSFTQIELSVSAGINSYSAVANINGIADSKWHYACVDMYVSSLSSVSKSSAILTKAAFPSSVGNVMIDAVTIRKQPPPSYQDIETVQQRRLFPNLQIYLSTLNVALIQNSSLTISYRTTNCSYNLTQVVIRQNESSTFSVNRNSLASAPVTGSFDLSWNNQVLSGISANMNENFFKNYLESIKDFGSVTVQRSKDCSGYKWRIKWINGGDKPDISIASSNLAGNNPSITSTKVQDGGAKFYPLLDDILRSHHSKSQVSVLINNIASRCAGSCDFEWLESATPTVSSIDTSNIQSIVITGTGFDVSSSNNLVKIGETICDVLTATETQLTCKPGNGPVGVYNFTVNVLGKGSAIMNSNANYEFILDGTDYNPKSSGVGGGAILTITGTGFTSQTSVKIDSKDCVLVDYSYTKITCTIPSNPTTSDKLVDIVLSEGSYTKKFSTKFSYDFSNTPRVLNVSPTVLSVLGNEIVTLTGSGLPVTLTSITIGKNKVKVISSSSTEIKILTPSLNPGFYDILIPVANLGNAMVNTQLEFRFFISSITPSVGSIRGGTLVTIEGDGFSTNCSLNKVLFNVYECDVQSCTSSKIICKTRSVHTIHEITNDGYNNRYGFRYAWDMNYLTIKKDEIVSWSWQPPISINGLKFKVEQVADSVSVEPIGFSSGLPSEFGSYSYQFHEPGTYYYWSGFVDVNNEISFRAVIEVLNATTEKEFSVDVTLNDIKAQKCSFPFTYNGVEYNSCTNVDQSFSWCSPTPVYSGQLIKCDPTATTSTNCSTQSISSCANANNPDKNSFKFTYCQIPQVTSISPLHVNYDTLITIDGIGFSSTECENEVYIGGALCATQSTSTTQITCKLGANSGVRPNKPMNVEILVKNIGYALQNEYYQVTFHHKINSITPTQGSTTGGTRVIIQGDGFTRDTYVVIGSTVYDSTKAEINYDTITLITEPNVGQSNVVVMSNNGEAQCDASCTFEFSSSIAPELTSVSPLSVDAATDITINGKNFVTNSSSINIQIGNQKCTVSSASTTQITCRVDGLDLGAQNIRLNIPSIGNSLPSSVKITGSASLQSVSPISGSINGGTRLTLLGNGFNNSTQIKISNSICQIVEVKINEAVCITSPGQAQNNVLLQVNNGATSYPNSGVSFSYSLASTPVISSISPLSESALNSELTIAGSGFSTDTSKVHVWIGGSGCNITSASETQIKCKLGVNSAGKYAVNMLIDGKGLAANTTEFTYNLILSSLSNTQSGVYGGLRLKVNGYGFSSQSKVLICNNECQLVNTSNTEINCIVPKSSDLSKDSDCTLVVRENNLEQTSNFKYVKSITPQISSNSPLRGGTGGGTVLTISGINLPSTMPGVKITIAGSECEISTINTTTIVCLTGSFDKSSTKALVQVYVDGVGLAINENSYFEYIDLWSSRFTWGGNPPPADGEVVVISESQTVYFDTETPILKGIIIIGGSLIFDDTQDVHLRAEYIIITSNGRLQIGTEDKPFLHNAKITMFGSVRSIELPIFGSKVIALREGTIDMHGKPVGVTWTHLGQTANAGASQITLKEPVIWEVGSQIVIASTGDHLSQSQNEARKITAVSADKRTLTLDTPLGFTHLSVTKTVGSGADARQLEIKAEVGLLTRNVVYQGNNDESWASLKTANACPDGFNPGEFATQTCFLGRYGAEVGTDEFGATIMVHGDSLKQKFKETVFIKISNVEFFHVGQAFRLGRYPIHFHMNGDMPSSYVRECAIHESFNRAVNIHATNYVTIERNFIYNILGGAYFMEDGVEIGNVFKYNLAIFVKTSSSLLNEDVTPAAFWVTNPNNTYLHNAVAGGSHFGWWYRILDKPDGASFKPDYCPKKQPMGRFFNNSVHGVGRFGLWIFPGYYPSVTGGCNDRNPSIAKFEHFTTYRNDKGAEWVMANGLQFRNFVSFDNTAVGIETKQIIFNENVNSDYGPTFYNESTGPLVADSVIVGNSDSTQSTSISNHGLVVAWDRGLLVKNVSFYNFPDTSSNAIKATEVTGRCTIGCGGWTTRFTGLSFTNVMHRTLHRWQWDFVAQDLDGSLSGIQNGFVVATNNFTRSNPKCEARTIFKDGSLCRDSLDWIRFAFNNLISSAYNSLTNVTNSQNVTISIPYFAKRLTHPKGYMIALEANQEYLFEYTNVLYPINLTYNGMFSNIYPNQYVIIKHQLLKKPDRVEFGVISSSESFKKLDATSNKGEWYWDNDTSTLSYIITNKEGRRPFLDVGQVTFKAYKCRYANCEPPVSPSLKLPVTSRSPSAIFWSNSSTWFPESSGWVLGNGANANYRLPQDGESIRIPDGKYVVVDIALPKLKYLVIEGILELDNGINHKLEADVIFINGGQLIVGWENNPILTDVQIILNGQKDSLNFQLPNLLDSIGGKAIGVYGGLDIHGRPRHPAWTTLNLTVPIGSNSIKLKDPVDWQIGEQIVITTTSYIVNQSEVVTISGKSSDNKTLILSSPLKYEHLGFSETFDNSTSYRIGAGVGLLSRNVKIIGSEYSNQDSDLYGFRIIVSDYSVNSADGLLYYKGYARLSNVEMVHPGQFSRYANEEYRYGILYSNLDAYNYSRPSYVNNCAFRDGYSAAIGILGSASIPITNNVIYHTIDYGIYASSHSNIIKKNLVVSNRWIVSFRPWEAVNEKIYMGSIDIHLSESAVVEDNFIAGSERVGLLYRGDVCPGDSFEAGKNNSIKNNIIYSATSGVTILPGYSFNFLNCIRISGFTIFKSSFWGIYYQDRPSVLIESNVLVDNQINVFTQIIQPSILDHTMSNKKTFINNTLIVGQSPSFNCLTDVKSRELYHIGAGTIVPYTAGPNEKAKVGLTWAQFLSSSNMAPFKPWTGIKAYNSLDGILVADGITFAHFNKQCGGIRDYVISTNKKNDDAQHPTHFRNTKIFDVDHDSKVWIHRPNLEKINPADCVDMDCDGLKKCLINDEDGSFLGQPGSVIPQSEFDWGSQQRGLGDFRIPKEALAAPDGTMLPISNVYTYRGIVREEDKCSFRTSWQAYECTGLDYKVLTIESMDPDTEHRRLSPIAIISDNKYIDLINGPQDHGWCFGYTCQKRVSSFMAIVAANKKYDIYLSSTPPKTLRFRILNADANFKIGLSMYYFTSNRIDVYKNDRFVLPTNGYYEEGKMKFNDTTSNLQSYMPNLSSPSGTNLAVRADRKVYSTLGGSDYFDFKMAAVVVLKFGVPSITPEAFFNPKTLVQNFADLLGIDPSKIRQVNIIRESRRKRQINGIQYFELVLFDNPSNQSNFSSQDEQSAANLLSISANVTSLFTTGQLQQLAERTLNISLAALSVEKPLENSNSEIRLIDKIKVIREASNCREQSPCQIQPIIVVLDTNNQTVIGLESISNPWRIRAKLVSTSNPNCEIIFETEVGLQNDGFVQFKNLGLSNIANSFVLEYELVPPTGMSLPNIIPVRQISKSCTQALLDIKPQDETLILDINETFNLTLLLVDRYSQKAIKNMSWRGHQWQASARIYTIAKNQPTGSLRSSLSQVEVDVETGKFTLLELYIDASGMYLIDVIIKSTDNEYFLRTISKPIIVKPSTQSIVLNDSEAPTLYLTFDKNITQNTNMTEVYKAIIYNSFILKYNLTLTRSISIYDNNMANLAFASSTNSNSLRTELNNGFVLADGINLIKATLNDADLSVKVVVEASSGDSYISSKNSGTIKQFNLSSILFGLITLWISFRLF